MCLLFADSFDHYQTANILQKWTSSQPTASSIVAGAGRCGTAALLCNALSGITKGLTVGGTTTVGFCGFAMKVHAATGSTVFGVLGSGAVYDWYASWRADGSFRIYNGASNLVIATSPVDIVREDNYYFVEFGWLISATVGTVTIKVNGVQQLAATGLNNYNASNGSTTWTSILVSSSNNANCYFDDLYVCDNVDDGLTPATNTFLGDVRVEYRRPTANGFHQDFALVGAANHFTAVDDNATPDSDTSYIWSATSGNIDTEIYEDTGLPSGSIYGVQVLPFARKTDAGARTIASVIRSGGGADSIGTDKAPSTAYEYLHQMFQNDPNTAARWTIANFNASEFGVKVTS